MSTILVVGDGPLAADMAALAERAGHTVIRYLFDQDGPQSSALATMPAYVSEVADTLDLAVEAVHEGNGELAAHPFDAGLPHQRAIGARIGRSPDHDRVRHSACSLRRFSGADAAQQRGEETRTGQPKE